MTSYMLLLGGKDVDGRGWKGELFDATERSITLYRLLMLVHLLVVRAV